MSEKVQKLNQIINEYIRPTTFPVAIHLTVNGETAAFKAKRPVKNLGHRVATCQAVSLARRFGWTLILAKEDHGCPPGRIILGHDSNEKMLEGKIAYPGYAASLEAAMQMEKSNYYLPLGKYQELWIAPLDKAEFEPDVILTYGNAAQIARMVQGANYLTGKGVVSRSYGRGACSSYIARTLLEDDYSLVVPSGGERVFAHAQDDEIIFSIPSSKIEDITFGIETVHKQGLSRFPTPFFGMGVEPAFPKYYWDIVD